MRTISTPGDIMAVEDGIAHGVGAAEAVVGISCPGGGGGQDGEDGTCEEAAGNR